MAETDIVCWFGEVWLGDGKGIAWIVPDWWICNVEREQKRVDRARWVDL